IVSLIPRPLFLVFLFLLTLPPPPRSTLFPYTTLFRSGFRTCPAPRALRPRPGLLPGTLHVQDDGPAAHQHPLEVRAAGALEEPRSEEHTSELQSPCNLVCRLLLEKKKKTHTTHSPYRH